MSRVKKASNLYFFGAAGIPLKIKQKYGLDADAIEIAGSIRDFKTSNSLTHAGKDKNPTQIIRPQYVLDTLHVPYILSISCYSILPTVKRSRRESFHTVPALSRRQSSASVASTFSFTSYHTAPATFHTMASTIPVETPSDFMLYLIQERAKSVPIAPYELTSSIRIWLKQFEQQTKIHGITSMDNCTPHLTRYMPLIIQQWIPTLSPQVTSSWTLLTEALITRFGVAADEDNRILLKQLKACKQQPNESVRLNAAKWEHLLSLITTEYTDKTKITYFIQSLNSRDTKLTLTSLVFSMKLDSVSQVINHAIVLEIQAKLLDEPETVTQQSAVSDPMDLDYMSSHSHQYKKQAHNNTQPKQLRAYDKHGNLICDLCRGKHRTVDHKKKKPQQNNHNKQHHHHHRQSVNNKNVHNVRELNTIPTENQSTSSFSVDISHFASNSHKLPRSTILVNGKPISLLWDTGADINGIQLELFNTMHAQLNTNERIAYRDVNNNIELTCGTAVISVFGQDIKVHVIDGLSSRLIVGWNTITKFKGNIDSDTGTVTLVINNNTIKIPLDNTKEPNINNMDSATYDITQLILYKFDSIIAKNPDKPSVTNLTEFYIDTGDHAPIYCKPRTFHPDLQAEIDDKLESMVENGLLEKVAFSQWGSQVRPVEKPDGSMRVCGNYIPINRITQPVNYPFPNMHNILQSLGQAKVFSKADLAQGYF
ncbi:hypothetical protein [Parasitella parasitica]|uniref:Peptidase A2 domain-containing protein n=1 Tax=Parasitella parasitica TaxID=35722 RepID=A0A0B7NK12_9FUNG|nr:hypothetical protein [Parasitella parasitica]